MGGLKAPLLRKPPRAQAIAAIVNGKNTEAMSGQFLEQLQTRGKVYFLDQGQPDRIIKMIGVTVD